MKVLIVEDNEIDRDIAVRFLAKLEIQTECVNTLEEATRLDCQEHFDLILLDTILPDSCSPQVATYFAETARAAVVVIITGCPKEFANRKVDCPLVVVDKNDFAGRLHDVLDTIRTKLATAASES